MGLGTGSFSTRSCLVRPAFLGGGPVQAGRAIMGSRQAVRALFGASTLTVAAAGRRRRAISRTAVSTIMGAACKAARGARNLVGPHAAAGGRPAATHAGGRFGRRARKASGARLTAARGRSATARLAFRGPA